MAAEMKSPILPSREGRGLRLHFSFELEVNLGIETFWHERRTIGMKGVRRILLLGFFLFFLPFQAAAQFPAISLTRQISGLSLPVHITHAGDGSGRLFIVEQPGRIRIVKNGVLLVTPFLDIGNTGANRVLFGGEQGLLSVAFPPGFNVKGYFYVYYTNLNGDNVAARYFLTANPDVADPNSEVILQTFSHPIFANHNGGQLAFGPDGFLYIGTGDGGSGGDPIIMVKIPALS